MASVNEEALREAACVGNLEELESILKLGVDVNSTNKVNGWTALHWASKRGHTQAVETLLKAGADKTIQNTSSETAADLTGKENIRKLLGAPPLDAEDSNMTGVSEKTASFTPNYLSNPDFIYSKAKHADLSKPTPSSNHFPADENGFLFRPQSISLTEGSQWSPSGLVMRPDFIVLCVRLANVTKIHGDFTEVEISRHKAPSLEKLTEILCESLDLGIKPEHVQKIRKLPNTALKNDRDVIRLTDYQMLEIVLHPHALHPLDGALLPSDRVFGEQPDSRYIKEHVSKLVY